MISEYKNSHRHSVRIKKSQTFPETFRQPFTKTRRKANFGRARRDFRRRLRGGISRFFRRRKSHHFRNFLFQPAESSCHSRAISASCCPQRELKRSNFFPPISSVYPCRLSQNVAKMRSLAFPSRLPLGGKLVAKQGDEGRSTFSRKHYFVHYKTTARSNSRSARQPF